MKIFVFLLIFISGLTYCTKDDDNVISDFYMYPSPYSSQSSTAATFKITLSQDITDANVTITIKDQSNIEVWNYNKSLTSTSGTITIKWSGENENSISLAPGVYLVEVSVGAGTEGLIGESNVEIIII